MSRSFKIIVVFVLLVSAWILFARFLATALIIEKPLEKADVILILGGSSVYQERTQKAAIVYHQSIAPTIVLTDDEGRAGWSRKDKINPFFVDLAKQSLIAQGIAPESIEIIKPRGSGTIYEAQILRDKAREKNWKRILIVTSAYHTRRSLWTFERVFAEENLSAEFGIVAAPTGQQTPQPFLWWLSPFGWEVVAGEYVKSFYYWVYY